MIKDMQKFINKLDLRALDIYDNSKFKENETSSLWQHTTKTNNTLITYFINKSNQFLNFSAMIDIEINDKFAWLEKLNDINAQLACMGIACSIDEESDAIVVGSMMFNEEEYDEEELVNLINISILFIPTAIQKILN